MTAEPGRLPEDIARGIVERLGEWVGTTVVVDCAERYVAIGILCHATEDYLELRDADMHDLRDMTTSRETYVVKVARHGVAANRASLVVRMDQVVGISPLSSVVSE